MKNEKGITLNALILYVIMFSATMAILATLTNYIYGNLDKIKADNISSGEFNKFNTHFVKDLKESYVATVTTNEQGETLITFDNGSKYTYKSNEKSIYKGKEKIARDISTFSAKTAKENNKDIIEISVKVGKDANNPIFVKTIKYVLKYW